jgi:hypothetical protein
MELPKNYKQKWTDEDKQLCKKMLFEKKEAKETAKLLERQEHSILLKYEEIIADEYKMKKFTIEEIVDKTIFSKEKVEFIISLYLKYDTYEDEKYYFDRKVGDYENIGRIYKLFSSETDRVYIGSTKAYITRRLNEHVSKFIDFLLKKEEYCSSYEILKYDFEKAKIELIELYPYNDVKELIEREKKHIQENKDKENVMLTGERKISIGAMERRKKKICDMYCLEYIKSIDLRRLNKSYHPVVKSWWNQLKKENKVDDEHEYEKLEWVYKNHLEIYDIIDKGKYELTTKSKYTMALYTIVDVFEEELGTKYYNIFMEHEGKIQNVENVNMPSGKEVDKMITMDELLLVIEYFKNYKSNVTNIIHTMLMLYCKQPLRRDYCNMEIINVKPTDTTKNYLYYNNENYKDSRIFIYKDKVSGRGIHQNTHEYTIEPSLLEEIKISLERFPRKYILSDNTGENALGPDRMINYMACAFFMCNILKTVTPNNFRVCFSSCQNYSNLSTGELKNIAERMRSSVDKMQTAYRKLGGLKKYDAQIDKALIENFEVPNITKRIQNEREKAKKQKYEFDLEKVKNEIRREIFMTNDEITNAQKMLRKERNKRYLEKKKAANNIKIECVNDNDNDATNDSTNEDMINVQKLLEKI